MANDNVKFRIAASEDARQLLQLINSAYRGEESKQGWTTEDHLFSWSSRINLQSIDAKLAAPNTTILIATDDDGVLVACCEVYQQSDGVGSFQLLAVDPRRQRGGLGRQMLAHVEDYSREVWGATRVELTTLGARKELVAWYLRRGYVNTGKTEPFPYAELARHGPTRDDLYFLVLAKDLSASSAPAASTG